MMFKVTTQEEVDIINADYFKYFPRESGIKQSGCNYYTNTGSVWNEPLGTAMSMHECGDCPKIETCELKKDTPVWLLVK